MHKSKKKLSKESLLKTVTKMLTIEEVVKNENSLEVHHYFPQDEETSITNVEISAYEDWLEKTGKLSDVYDTTGADGNHVQYVSEFPISDYWLNASLSTIHADMKEYLMKPPKVLLPISKDTFKKSIVNQLKNIAQSA